jgi:hypothetical protein
MPKPDKQQALQLELVGRWNATHAVGCAVTVELDSGKIVATRTRSQAQMLGAEPSRNDPGHTAVIWLEGITGCYCLNRVRAKGGVLSCGRYLFDNRTQWAQVFAAGSIVSGRITLTRSSARTNWMPCSRRSVYTGTLRT